MKHRRPGWWERDVLGTPAGFWAFWLTILVALLVYGFTNGWQ